MAAAAAAFCSSLTWAAVTVEPLEASHAFTVNGKVYGQRAVELLVGGIRSNNAGADAGGILRGMIENQLMTEEARRVIHRHEAHLAQRHRLWREYGLLMDNLFKDIPTDGLHEACVKTREVPGAMLQLVIGAQNKQGQIVRPGFTPIAKQYASQVTVAEIRCEGVPTSRITFAEIIDASDEGMALRVWRGDKAAINQLRDGIIGYRLKEASLIRSGKMTPLDIDTLWRMVEAKQTRVEMEQYAGVTYDIHHSPVRIQELKQHVTEAEIDAWYEVHKNDYQQIATVKARQITLATQQEADRVLAEIQGGLSFEDAVTKYSISPDKAANPRGELPLIRRNDPLLGFREKMALVLPEGVSPSYRMPDGKSFVIYHIDQREGEVVPKNDPSVRSTIRGEIAHRRAGEEYIALRKRVWKDATVRVNSVHYPASITKGWGE